MSRARPLLAAGAVLALGLGAAGVQLTAMSRVEGALRARGVEWSARRASVGRAEWSELVAPGVTVARLSLSLAPWPAAQVHGVDIDLKAVEAPPPQRAGAAGASPALADLGVSVTDLTVRWGEHPLLEGLGGAVRPRVVLQGPAGFLRQEADGAWVARLTRAVEAGPLQGEVTLDARCDAAGATCTLSARSEAAVLSHPLLAPTPLSPAPLRVSLTVDRGAGTAAGEVRYDALKASVAVSADRMVTVDARALPLTALVDRFAGSLPEARGAALAGTLGARLVYDLDARTLRSIEPAADGLAAAGVLPDPGAWRRGSFTWRAPIEDGWVPRTTGDGLPGWTPLSRAGLAPAAMIAAEDAAFRSHPGYHLPAIREALDAWMLEPDSAPRGGSTITQQLAKNLFCDPMDRTLARKLRELIYALDLERTLPKERILELYINIVELGPDLYGVGPAADAYFIKQPARLTPTEAAFVAAILPSPRRGYARAVADRPPRARMAAILENMALGGALDPRAAAHAADAPLTIVPIRR